MKENKRNYTVKKDYYFSVMLSQIFTLSATLLLFFFLKGGESGKEIVANYKQLLKEDFLTYSVSSAVSQMKEYLSSSESVLAVFGNRVECVEITTTSADQTASTTKEMPTEKETEEPSAQVFATIDVSQIEVKDTKEKVKPQTMTLENKKTEKQQMLFPVEGGRYTSYFGERTDPISEGSDYHNGVDIGADEGDEILAVYDGTVTLTGEDDRSGKYIFLSHDDTTVTFYCHCSEILLEEGDKVRQGDVIALVGSTGYSTGPHLHFELRNNGESIDPLPLLENAD